MANMNMIIHDMEDEIEIGDTFKNPKFRTGNRLQTFDRVVSNPMWNQDWWREQDLDADELGRFPQGAGFPGAQSADWGWVEKQAPFAFESDRSTPTRLEFSSSAS
jgi:type I restriction enzyme M protein